MQKTENILYLYRLLYFLVIMKKRFIKKLFITTITLRIVILTKASAHDCHLFTEQTLRDFDTSIFRTSVKNVDAINPITKEWLQKALINLKTQCCNENILNNNPKMLASCKADENLIKNRTDYAQSVFLFDHLIDIWIRRLKVYNLYSGVKADEQAQKWIEELNEQLTTAEGKTPPEISKNRKEYWWLEGQEQYILPNYNWVSQQEYQGAIKDTVKNTKTFEEYKKRNLLTKYKNICQESIYLMTYLPIDFKSSELTKAQEKCTVLIQKILNEETVALRDVIDYKAQRLIFQNIEEYAQNYLFTTRAMKAQENMLRWVSNAFGVVRMIPKLIKKCN